MTAQIIAFPLATAQKHRSFPLYWHDSGRVMKFGAPPQAMTEADQRAYVSQLLDRMEIAAFRADDEGFDLLHEQLIELIYARRAAQNFQNSGGDAA